jgi:hypothetical protein
MAAEVTRTSSTLVRATPRACISSAAVPTMRVRAASPLSVAGRGFGGHDVGSATLQG